MSLLVSYSMLCAGCASPVPDGGRFCTNCGADVPDPSSAGPPSLDAAGVATLTRLLRQETAGEYEIEREIGRGGMGIVYLATEIQLRRRVAIKVLPPTRASGERAVQRFQREARTAAALDHPNIIPIHRVSSGGELMWYSMKLLSGRSLDAVLQEKERLTLEETVAIVDPVADALQYAHQHGVIHRDVKPGNIMLDDRGRVTVTDFGIAKGLEEGSVTLSGGPLGTPYYMSPEQYLGEEVSGAADQYALGVVAYQCVAGAVPFEATSAYELLHQHTTMPPPPLAELRPGLPGRVYQAIERAMAKRPEDRFPTVTDFADAVAGRVAGPGVPRRTGPRRSRMFTGSAAAALAAATLYLGVAVLGPKAAELQPGHPAEPPVAAAGGPAPSPADAAAEVVPGPGPAAVRPPTAILIVRLTSGWARIYLDGEFRGERPVHREELPPGTHTLRLERPGFVPADTTFTLRAGQNLIEIEMRRVTP
ncbi:MAG TPA: protein kinase [Gemmatimonadales bacterium]|nr:protein kinase [Gemmatimonadales bacterium]